MKVAFLALFLFAHVINLTGQQDSIPVDSLHGRSPYTKFKKEFSFDIRGVLYAAPTASVIYRVRYGEKRRINLYNKKVFRIYANGYFGFPLNEKTKVDTVASNNYYYYSSVPYDRQYADINLFVGIEKQHFFGRLIFYRGVEVGGGWMHSSTRYFTANAYRQDLSNEMSIQEARIMLSILAGIKYFVIPKISIALECNAFGGMSFLHREYLYYAQDSIVVGNFTKVSTEFFEQNPFFKINGLRALNIGYHF